jgi:CMP/dCMP kinase
VIIAIDGPAGAGKSTTARAVARQLGYLYLDTGAMYRTVAHALREHGEGLTAKVAERVMPQIRIDFSRGGDGSRVYLNGEDVTEAIRTAEAGVAASVVSGWRVVREALMAEQRRLATEEVGRGGGVVLDGRDIGTVVFPDADAKFFLVADPVVRAQRRQAELSARGEPVALEAVLAEILERDRVDSERALAPLKIAEDAFLLDTTYRSVEEQVASVIEQVRERMGGSTVEPSS